MNRALEEILNTPVEFKEGMRVFSLYSFKFVTVDEIDSGTDTDTDYPIYIVDDNGGDEDYYTIDGKYHVNKPYRGLLTEQEAYELFPSLKPKVYEYRVIYECASRFYFTENFCINKEEFREIYKNEACVFFELYQPSKRERKS